MKPIQINNANEVVAGIHRWEARISSLKSRHDEDIRANLKVAILVGMLPKEYQDIILQGGLQDKDLKYEVTRDKIIAIANQKIQMITPMPMDVGNVDAGLFGENERGDGDSWDVEAVGKGGPQCYSCGGIGHMARDCYSGKGKGKGDKGFGKGYQSFGKGGDKGYKGGSKGGYKGYQPYWQKGDKGGKADGKGSWQNSGGGKGYGYQGTCWKCGQVGHKSHECAKGINGVEEIQKDECSVEIGGIWNICNVEKMVRDSPKVRLHNMWQGFEDEEDVVDEQDLNQIEPPPGFPKLQKDACHDCKGRRGCRSEGFQRIRRKGWKTLRAWNYDEDFDDEVWIQPVESGSLKTMKLGFQVAAVKKPLIAVKRIVEQGNVVQFGKKEDDNFILNTATGDKMMLKPNGRGSYVMQVRFHEGDKTEVTVDSGAEESVCPWDWGLQFGTKSADRWMNFRDASGNRIPHYGTRDVLVSSGF